MVERGKAKWSNEKEPFTKGREEHTSNVPESLSPNASASPPLPRAPTERVCIKSGRGLGTLVGLRYRHLPSPTRNTEGVRT